jgi:hypothetical protein
MCQLSAFCQKTHFLLHHHFALKPRKKEENLLKNKNVCGIISLDEKKDFERSAK